MHHCSLLVVLLGSFYKKGCTVFSQYCSYYLCCVLFPRPNSSTFTNDGIIKYLITGGVLTKKKETHKTKSAENNKNNPVSAVRERQTTQDGWMHASCMHGTRTILQCSYATILLLRTRVYKRYNALGSEYIVMGKYRAACLPACRNVLCRMRIYVCMSLCSNN